jgi:hypothetical protein
MNAVIAKMRSELRGVLKASVGAYPGQPRDKWLFDWSSQIILVVNQIFWCQEVEKVRAHARPRGAPWRPSPAAGPAAGPPPPSPPRRGPCPQAFADMASGKPSAMRAYNEFQVKQLTRLIEVTRTGLARPDRQKVRRRRLSGAPRGTGAWRGGGGGRGGADDGGAAGSAGAGQARRSLVRPARRPAAPALAPRSHAPASLSFPSPARPR